MKNNIFTIKNNKLLCWRLGPVNIQKQKHYNKDVEVFGLSGSHKPPESRGVWAFPYPHYDFFFCYHQYKRHLPKKFQLSIDTDKYSDEYMEKYWEEHESTIEKIRKRIKPSTFYIGEFYSHIFPNGLTNYNEWFYWDSVKDWERVARKTIAQRERHKDRLYTINFGKDHLEIFITRL